jgi:tetratricopeptide (TPR) repeat protein
MKNFLKLILLTLFLFNPLFAKNNYFKEGIDLFNDKKFEKAKFKFEKDIVFNPKNEISYLYLSKIFKSLNKKKLQEKNLKTVILLDPKNEEAVFYLAELKLDSSDYDKSRELNNKLISICIDFCDKSKKLKIDIDNLSKK